MGRLIVLLGNIASGKTTLAQQLQARLGWRGGLEQPAAHPFQADFIRQPRRFACHNQVDFLLTRAEEEARIRAAPQPGIQDGGLEMDFHVFTALFHRRGDLDAREWQLCQRLYAFVRSQLPLPDLVIWLDVNPQTARERFLRRARPVDAARADDIPLIHQLLTDRIAALQAQGRTVWRLDVNPPDPGLRRTLAALLPRLQAWSADDD